MAHPTHPSEPFSTSPRAKLSTPAMPDGLPAALRTALERRGIRQLYTHQAEAFTRIAAGEDVVIVTPTASGKTLCYNLPVLDRLSREPEARAMYLFPTKALSEDQSHEFQGIVEADGADIRAFTYDGDTPPDSAQGDPRARQRVLTQSGHAAQRNPARTTPGGEVLSRTCAISSSTNCTTIAACTGATWRTWSARLKRICEFYGSSPQFIAAQPPSRRSARTGGRADERACELIDRNGAPSGDKYIVFYNPPVVNRQLGIRRSYLHEARRIALETIEHGQQTLVFANSRLATELLVTYLKDACERGPLSAEAVRGYRGGYLPRERREIERKLRDATSGPWWLPTALELGIDIVRSTRS